MRWSRPIEPVEFRGTLAPNLRPTLRRIRALPPRLSLWGRQLQATITRGKREGAPASTIIDAILVALRGTFGPAPPPPWFHTFEWVIENAKRKGDAATLGALIEKFRADPEP
jgi:hypothetical protein